MKKVAVGVDLGGNQVRFVAYSQKGKKDLPEAVFPDPDSVWEIGISGPKETALITGKLVLTDEECYTKVNPVLLKT